MTSDANAQKPPPGAAGANRPPSRPLAAAAAPHPEEQGSGDLSQEQGLNRRSEDLPGEDWRSEDPERDATARSRSDRDSGSLRDSGTSLYSEAFLRRVGQADAPVLLHGETGAGKEVMARRLWSYSSRASKPFLKLNCAALPSELVESELFGYEKGAFTGATMDKPGRFELAQNGTILLDEIGDMDFRLQAKLLQVLQDGEVQPLGSTRIVNVNVRVMAATHRDLRKAIAEGNFREDLYYRLSVVNLTVPPLRERRAEILPLAASLLLRYLPEGAQAPAITEPLRQAMLAYPWPGNVRELENAMRRLIIYQDARILARELWERPGSTAAAARMEPTSRSAGAQPGRADGKECDSGERGSGEDKVDLLAQASREAESKLLLETLEAVRWNRRQAAARLNVDYRAFLYKLQKHGIVERRVEGGVQSRLEGGTEKGTKKGTKKRTTMGRTGHGDKIA